MLRRLDRIYGELDLPDEALRLAATCPVLLRLREIRMANIPFYSYPSFANVDRYEHSLGVAHLAWRWGMRNGLSKDQCLAFTLAALYHDGATPAFGHLFEEYLFRHDWNHEEELIQLLLGKSTLPGGEDAQVFLGGHCQLTNVLDRSPFARYVTALDVADMAAGAGDFGRLIKGDIDLDNIDNVLRASSAMGLTTKGLNIHPYQIVDALVLEDGEVRIRQDGRHLVGAWSNIRHRLYSEILNNPLEFRAQSTYKWAIEQCASSQPELRSQRAWRITDPEMVFDHLRRDPLARLLVDRVRRGRPPELLFSAWFRDLSPVLGVAGPDITRNIAESIEAGIGMKVYVNYYLDKRARRIQLGESKEPVLFDSKVSHPLDEGCIDVMSCPGLVGVVGISWAEHCNALGSHQIRAPLAGRNRSYSVGDFRLTLERELGQPGVAASDGWVGTQQATNQLSLFSYATR